MSQKHSRVTALALCEQKHPESRGGTFCDFCHVYLKSLFVSLDVLQWTGRLDMENVLYPHTPDVTRGEAIWFLDEISKPHKTTATLICGGRAVKQESLEALLGFLNVLAVVEVLSREPSYLEHNARARQYIHEMLQQIER